jgi:hypothetical protein
MTEYKGAIIEPCRYWKYVWGFRGDEQGHSANSIEEAKHQIDEYLEDWIREVEHDKLQKQRMNAMDMEQEMIAANPHQYE